MLLLGIQEDSIQLLSEGGEKSIVVDIDEDDETGDVDHVSLLLLGVV